MAVAPHYTVLALPLVPVSINTAGQVAGTTPDYRAAIWSRRAGLRLLPLPEGFSSAESVAINDSGRVIGMAYDNLSTRHQAFLFANNVLTLLGAEQARVYGIGEQNIVVGESLVAGQNRTEPVLWNRGKLTALPNCCGGAAKAINAHGEVIGDSYDEHGQYHAFLWSVARGARNLGTRNGYSSAIAINDHGHVLIHAFSEVFLYAAGRLEPVRLSPHQSAQPRSLNNCDVIVGSFGPYSDAARAFIWERSRGFHDLNTRIAAGTGWKLEQASQISDRGEIVGQGDFNGRENQGFLLVPAPAGPLNRFAE